MEFEHVYGLIFGSQIDAIRFLNTSRTASSLTIFYQQHVERVENIGQEVGKFTQWVVFMVNQGLIVPSEAENTFRITDKGSAFLAFIESRRYSNKNL